MTKFLAFPVRDARADLANAVELNVEPLSPRRWAILRFIDAQQRSAGRTPSLEEIAEAVGIRHGATVGHHMRALEERGLIRRVPHGQRAVQVLVPLPDAA
jgi:repressor LexA